MLIMEKATTQRIDNLTNETEPENTEPKSAIKLVKPAIISVDILEERPG
jgi:hypothetical protein